jgi:PKD repeat protein
MSASPSTCPRPGASPHHWLALTFAAVTLTACGGGNTAPEAGTPPPAPQPAPAPPPPPGPAPAPGASPTAAFTAAPNSLRERYLATFDAAASGDSDGSIADFAWDFGDGSTAHGAGLATGRHAYAAAGSYEVALTVTDNSGLHHRIAQTITIAPNAALRVAAGPRHTLLQQPGQVTTLGLWMQGYADDYLDPAVRYWADCRGHAIGSREINDPVGGEPLYRPLSRTLGFGPAVGAMAAGLAFSAMTATNAGDSVFSWGVNFGSLGNGSWTPHRAQFYPVGPESLPNGVPPAADQVLMSPARPGYVYHERDGSPVAVDELDIATRFTGIVQLAAGRQHVLALRRDGSVWSWGRADFGALGVGITRADFPAGASTPYAGKPQKITALTTRAVAVAANSNLSLVLDDEGHVWQAGSLDPNQVPLFVAQPEAATLLRRDDLSDIVAIAAGQFQGLALRADGTVWQWGFLVPEPPLVALERTPVAHQVPLLSQVVAISAGSAVAHAVRADGSLWGWGTSRVLGDGGEFLANKTVPVRIAGDVQAVVDGESHAIAVGTDGFLLGWGSNGSCQLGMADHEEEVLGYQGADAETKFVPAGKRYFGRPTPMGRGI